MEGIKYNRISIDEVRVAAQVEIENKIINPTRLDIMETRRIDLDFKLDGPEPLTHVDIKNPGGLSVLVDQNQTTTIQ